MKALLKSVAFVTLAAIALQLFGVPSFHTSDAGMYTAVVAASAGLRRMTYGGFLDPASSQPTAFHSYVTNHLITEVVGADYFLSEYARLAVNDIIEVSYDLDGTPGFKRLRVATCSSAGVTTVNAGDGVSGIGVGYKIARGGAAALDGSNPTPVATGLATIVAAFVQLRGTAAPGDNTSVLTSDFTGSDGTLNVYAWKNTSGSDPTLVASTGTETFDWIAIGT